MTTYKESDNMKNVFLANESEKVDMNSTVIQNFKKYSIELDRRHNKYESIVKLSRDINNESKRIIFLLHSFNRNVKGKAMTDIADSEEISQAELRLEALVNKNFMEIAKLLDGEDPYFYNKAYAIGMEEFLEAFIFLHYLKYKCFYHWDYYQNKLNYLIDESGKCIFTENPDSLTENFTLKKICAFLSPVDYFLALGDATGEFMRKCINNLGEGDIDGCLETCNVVRSLYAGFLTLNRFKNKKMSQKELVLKQSLLKMEMVCYYICIRGSEIPNHMLADISSQANCVSETDEI